jgi:F5/8 type C domain/Cellulase (glycosyl hydrolase family 5)
MGRGVGLAALAFVVLACTSTPVPAPTATRASTASPKGALTGAPTAAPTAAPTPAPGTRVPVSAPPTAGQEPEQHRIGEREGADGPELYDRVTGARFVPRGANYQRFTAEPDGSVVDTTFATPTWAPDAVAADLAAISAQGYNAVRVIFDNCNRPCIGDPGGGLDPAYLDHLVAFLRLAEQAGLQVMLASNDLPLDGGYVPQIQATCCGVFDGYLNTQTLSEVGLNVYRGYWTSVVRGLIERDAPMDAVLGYELRNEIFSSSDKPPLSLTRGTVTAANGRTYDLSGASDRAALLQDGTTYWLDQVGSAIRSLDPSALIGVGMFAPNAPNAWAGPDFNKAVAPAAVYASSVDYVDVHPYPGYVSFGALAQNLTLARGGMPSKPTFMGEFGAFRFAYATPQEGAAGLMDWQVASCRYGIQGWFQWHWTAGEDTEIWSGTDGDGAINTVLAPASRPDPCVTASFDFLVRDLAQGRPASASSSVGGQPPRLAVDGVLSTSWSAGTGPVSWIEVRLAGPETVTKVQLSVAMYPDGPARHEVWARIGGTLQRVHIFSGPMADGDLLTWQPPQPLQNVEAVRIQTTSSPSWVAWREIRVFGP